jgi:hypothetical protein
LGITRWWETAEEAEEVQGENGELEQEADDAETIEGDAEEYGEDEEDVDDGSSQTLGR